MTDIYPHGYCPITKEKPFVYLTGEWRDALNGGLNDVFSTCSELGLQVLDWRMPGHREKPWSEQSANIFDHIHKSKLFVLVIKDPKYQYFSSIMQLGAALAAGIPCAILDENDGTHKPSSEGGNGGNEGHHKIASGVMTFGARSTNQLCIVKSLDELKEKLWLLVGQC